MDTCIPAKSSWKDEGADRGPVLIAANPAAFSRARSAIEEAGWRAFPLALEELESRLRIQPSLDALWIEADDDGVDYGDVIARASAATRAPIVVSGSMSMLDAIAAPAFDAAADLVVDADATDRVSALSLAVAQRHADSALHDVSREPSAARLRQLSDEVGRIAATLARLSSGPSSAATELPAPAVEGAGPSVSGEQVRGVIRARRLRARYFEAELFADPAWDMLLDLLQAEIAQHRVPVSSLCIAAAVPPTTALRWIKTMTDAGMFNRRADPHDGRRVFVELAPQASLAMRRYFADVGVVSAA